MWHWASSCIKIAGWLGDVRKERTACCWRWFWYTLRLISREHVPNYDASSSEFNRFIDTLRKKSFLCSKSYILMTIWTDRIKFALIPKMYQLSSVHVTLSSASTSLATLDRRVDGWGAIFQYNLTQTSRHCLTGQLFNPNYRWFVEAVPHRQSLDHALLPRRQRWM